MYGTTRNKSPANDEVIDVLFAISKVSARLARNLSVLAANRQSEEGEKIHEQSKRNGYDHQRATRCCCRY